MESLLEGDTRFIGTIEHPEVGWRASFRLRVPNEVFAALKWLHTQAAERGFSSIELQRGS
jgi:hypothetical protein